MSDDENGIRNLMSQYSQLLDDRDMDKWSELFTVDATLEMLMSRVKGQANNMLVGRDAMKAAMLSIPRPAERVGMHIVLNSIIEVSGDHGDVSSDFIFFSQDTPDSPVIFLRGGRFTDVVVKQAGKWLFKKRTIKITMAS